MAKRRRSRVKSSIDRLPEETRKLLDELLYDVYNGLTYRDMVRIVEEECGEKLSPSAVQRYADRIGCTRDKVIFKQLDKSLIQLKALLDGKCPADVSALLLAYIQEGLMRRIQDGQDDVFDMPLKDAMKLALQSARASAYVYRYRDQTIEREEVDGEKLYEERIAWLRGVLRDDPELLRELIEEDRANDGRARMVCASGDSRDGGQDH